MCSLEIKYDVRFLAWFYIEVSWVLCLRISFMCSILRFNFLTVFVFRFYFTFAYISSKFTMTSNIVLLLYIKMYLPVPVDFKEKCWLLQSTAIYVVLICATYRGNTIITVHYSSLVSQNRASLYCPNVEVSRRLYL